MIEKNTIKSQDSLIDRNNGKRSSETLIQTISKLETTIEELERTKKQLEIAVECLETTVSLACPYFKVKTAKSDSFHQLKNIQKKCGIALQQIEELNK